MNNSAVPLAELLNDPDYLAELQQRIAEALAFPNRGRSAEEVLADGQRVIYEMANG